MSFFYYAWDWVTTSANWRGSDSIPQQLVAHLGYSALPLLIAALLAVPLGVLIGHTGKGAVFDLPHHVELTSSNGKQEVECIAATGRYPRPIK